MAAAMLVGSGDVTPHRTTTDVTTQFGRRTREHPRNAGVVTGGWRSGRTRDGNANERIAREDLGEEGPTSGSRLPVTEAHV
jgi:hypothetical protein